VIRVLIADDHPIVRKGLLQIVVGESDICVAAETGDAREALKLLGSEPFDAVILDISMPGMSGLEALSQIRSRHPKLPVLILSTHPESELAVRAVKAGAAGYLNKDLAPEELVGAIRHIASGRRYVSASVAEILAESLASPRSDPHDALTDREYEVLVLIAAGKSVSEIAREMALSVKTVSTYRTRILEKMRMRNNAELMRYAIQAGLAAKGK
jgi:two-component system invasion response regulator UvrY